MRYQQMLAKIFLIVLLFSFNNFLHANEDIDPISSLKINKSDMIQSLKMLKDMGKISETDYNKSIAEIEKMDDAKFESLTLQAKEMAKKNPDKAMEIIKDKNIDYKKVEALKNETQKD